MNLGLENQQVQNQQINLTPKMLEDLKILQMSNMDLIQYIEESAAENPLLEVEEPDAAQELAISEGRNEKAEEDNNIDYSEEMPDFLDYTGSHETLRENLVNQLGEMTVDGAYKKIALYIIDNIDSAGYLNTGIHEISRELNIASEKVVKALRLIQSMEPEGVGARNLKECLLIQLKRKKIDNPDFLTIIKDYLELLGEHKYDLISKKSGLIKSRVIEIHNAIKDLNPRPGYRFLTGDRVEFIYPELAARDEGTKFIVMYLNEYIPTLRLNDALRKYMTSGKANNDEKKYIKEKLSKAIEIINAIEMRKKTVLKIAEFIVNYQVDFLRKGYRYLKPLTMKTAANGVELHESTISRAVNRKYIQTPRGTFELRYFFSAKIHGLDENNLSANSAKEVIRKIVSEEDKSKPLSDEQIKRILEDKGIKAARRTIAKYRNELSILPAAIRKYNS